MIEDMDAIENATEDINARAREKAKEEAMEDAKIITPQPRTGLRKRKNFVPRILSHSAHANTTKRQRRWSND